MEPVAEIGKQPPKAQTEGDLALQWKPPSTAERYCRDLGCRYQHILAALPPDEANRIRGLFQHVDFSEKSLVLSARRDLYNSRNGC